MRQIPLNRALLALALASTIPASVLAANLAYVAQPLTVANATSVTAVGVNNDGVVVGVATVPSTTSGSAVAHAIVWIQGQASDLGPGQAKAVNASGHVAGSSLDANGNEDATLWIAQKPTLLGPGTAYAINSNDEVVGEALGTDGLRHPAVWRQGTLKLLSNQTGRATGINTSGQIVGYIATITNGATVYSAVRWVNDVPVILSNYAKANGINDAGVVVGEPTEYFASGPYYWTPDNQSHNAPLTTTNTAAGLTAINNSGMVVGDSNGVGLIGQITDHFSALGTFVKYADQPSYGGFDWINAYPQGVNDNGAATVVDCQGSGNTQQCRSWVLEPTGPVACTVRGGLSPISNFAFSGFVTLTNLTQGDLVGWQVNETLKDPTIVYRMSQARIKVSNGGKLLTATPTTTNQVISAGSGWSYNFGAAKFPATNPSITDLNATMGGQSCIWVN